MYFDNAATSYPKPEPVYREMDRFLRQAAANPGRAGHRMAMEAAAVVVRARQRLASLLNAPDARRVVWTANGTGALNLALLGTLRPGDRVVTTSLEHNSVARPLRALEGRGIRLCRVPCPGGRFDPEAYLSALTPDTRVAVAVHASNVTGELLPAAELAAECRSRGILFVLDAAQTAGAMALDVRELGASMVAMPGHKALLGPPGTGALYLDEGILPEPLLYGGTGSRSEQDEQPVDLPDRYESGTLNGAALAGLAAALEWLSETGVETVRRREDVLTGALWEALARIPGVLLYGPPPGGRRAPVLSFNVEGWDPAEAAAVLDEQFEVQCRAGLHCAPWAHRSLGTFPHGTVRLSPGFWNGEQEVEAVAAAVAALAAARG